VVTDEKPRRRLTSTGVAADEAIDVGNTASLDSPTADSQIPFDVDEQFQNGRTEAFADVLRQMALMTGATYADVDTWLVILHKKKPIPDYGKLPKNSRALFKPSPVYEDAFSSMHAMRAQVGKSTNAAMQCMHDAASNGEYVYFGLHDTLMARTPGQYLRRAYIALLRRIDAANSTVLPVELYNAAYEEEEKYRQAHAHFNPTAHGTACPSTVCRPSAALFTLKIFTDGVQVFQNSIKSSMYPLLASIHAVCPISRETGLPDRKRSKNHMRIHITDATCLV
jgi:hypothetical protein